MPTASADVSATFLRQRLYAFAQPTFDLASRASARACSWPCMPVSTRSAPTGCHSPTVMNWPTARRTGPFVVPSIVGRRVASMMRSFYLAACPIPVT